MRIISTNRASAVSGLALLLGVISFSGSGYRPGSAQEMYIDPQPENAVYFARSSAQLSPEGRETLRRHAAWLNEHPLVTVMIEGHTDSWGSRTWNMALGQRRAEEVRRFLMETGLAGTRISVISYGEERPMAICPQEQCWSQNRRAVTIISSDGETN